MKKLIPVLLAAALLCIACCSIAEKNSAEENAQPKILAVCLFLPGGADHHE